MNSLEGQTLKVKAEDSHLSVSDCQRVGLADFDKPLYLLAQRISGGFMIFANVNGSAENI